MINYFIKSPRFLMNRKKDFSKLSTDFQWITLIWTSLGGPRYRRGLKRPNNVLTITYSYLYHLLLFYLVGLFVCFSSPVKDAVMSAIKISSNKPDCRIVNCIQGLKSGGRGMLINHTTIIQHGENKLFM